MPYGDTLGSVGQSHQQESDGMSKRHQEVFSDIDLGQIISVGREKFGQVVDQAPLIGIMAISWAAMAALVVVETAVIEVAEMTKPVREKVKNEVAMAQSVLRNFK